MTPPSRLLGRLTLPDTLEAGVAASGFERLLITFSHAERAAAFLLTTEIPSIECWSPRRKPKA